MRHRLLIAAFGASVLAHAAVLHWTGGIGGREPSARPPLDARLALVPLERVEIAPAAAPAAPPPAPVAAPRPQPEPRAKAAPRPGAAVAVPPIDAAPTSDATVTPGVPDPALADAPAPEPLAEAPPPPAPVARAAPEQVAAAGDARRYDLAGWPRRGDIRFRVLLGERGFEVGEARHEWTHDRKRYRMTVDVETTGVMDALRRLRYRQTSEGRVGPKGLQPDRFGIEQSGKKPERAEFDWKAGEVTMRRGERTRTAPIKPGDQDLLSLWHQIGIVGVAGLPHELNVVSGKSAKPSLLEAVGAEELSLPIGRLVTQRIRARAHDGKLSIDIWLARDYGMLPVRIRLTDEKGEVLDQQAVELRLAPPGQERAQGEGGDAYAQAPDAVRDEEGEASDRDGGGTETLAAGDDAGAMIELREQRNHTDTASLYQ